jgi:hypothetical protein
VRVAKRIAPNKKDLPIMQNAYQIYRKIYPALRSVL